MEVHGYPEYPRISMDVHGCMWSLQDSFCDFEDLLASKASRAIQSSSRCLESSALPLKSRLQTGTTYSKLVSNSSGRITNFGTLFRARYGRIGLVFF